MHPLIREIVRVISHEKLFTSGEKVIIACSGGADSTALLHLLAHCGLGFQLFAVYLDHGLRPQETAVETAFVRDLASQLGATFVTSAIDVASFQASERCSLEEAARIRRFQELKRLMEREKAQAIAVAHTADDQVEEFLLRLIRGTGLKGLSGMSYRHGRVVRPLLGVSKQQLLDYLAENDIGHCFDSSNTDRRFLRNRIRLDLLPVLAASYNPGIRTTLLQTAEIFGQDESLLADMSDQLFRKICQVTTPVAPGELPAAIDLPTPAFARQHPALQRRLLETICWQMGSRPSFRQIEQLRQTLILGRTGTRYHLPQGLRAYIDQQTACFSHPRGRKAFRGDHPIIGVSARTVPGPGKYRFSEIGMELEIRREAGGPQPWDDPAALYIQENSVEFPLLVRPPLPGELIQPLGAPGRRKIARILSDLKIPAGERPRYPLLVSGDEPVAILGQRIADRCRVVDLTADRLRLFWLPINGKSE